jgi:uncharacterized protein (TIGR00266 family)
VQIDLEGPSSLPLARVRLEHGETVTSASGAVVAFTTGVEPVARSAGLVGGLRRLLGAESFAPSELCARRGPGEVLLAPAMCGAMAVLDVGPGSWLVSSGAFVASVGAVDVRARGGALSHFFAGAGLFVVEARGAGRLVVGAFGALEPLTVDGRAVVDTGHVVAWDASLATSLGDPATGLLASWLSGESATCTFTGGGTVWLQSRNLSEFGARVGRRLPPRGA